MIDDEDLRPRLHLRVIALLIAAALTLPVVIGTGVVIYRVLTDQPAEPDERTDLAFVAGFGRVGFRVNDSPAVRCALLAATEQARRQGMQGRRDLGGYDAMVFAFAEDSTTTFINHFVPVDLSIGWYDATGSTRRLRGDGRLSVRQSVPVVRVERSVPLSRSKLPSADSRRWV